MYMAETMYSVSYTHLDVYKGQVVVRLICITKCTTYLNVQVIVQLEIQATIQPTFFC